VKVLVTGGTGFTGSYVVPLLIRKGYDVRCFVRPTSDRKKLALKPNEWALGDLADFEALKAALQGVFALVNLASLGFGHARNIVRAVTASGVKRAVFLSTTAIFTTLNAPSKAVRVEAEEEIKTSGLEYTILRPTMIYGSRRDRNMCRLIRYLWKWPVMPIVGNGKMLQQPVYVGDVAAAVADCLGKDATKNKEYNIPGARPLTFDEVIDTITSLLGRRVIKFHLPASPLVKTLYFLEKRGIHFPIKAEQFMRLNEDKAFDYSSAAKDFGYAPRTFKEGITLQLAEMGFKRPPAQGGK